MRIENRGISFGVFDINSHDLVPAASSELEDVDVVAPWDFRYVQTSAAAFVGYHLVGRWCWWEEGEFSSDWWRYPSHIKFSPFSKDLVETKTKDKRLNNKERIVGIKKRRKNENWAEIYGCRRERRGGKWYMIRMAPRRVRCLRRRVWNDGWKSREVENIPFVKAQEKSNSADNNLRWMKVGHTAIFSYLVYKKKEKKTWLFRFFIY